MKVISIDELQHVLPDLNETELRGHLIYEGNWNDHLDLRNGNLKDVKLVGIRGHRYFFESNTPPAKQTNEAAQ